MDKNQTNPTLDFIVREAKRQIETNLHLIPQDMDISINLTVDDPDLHAHIKTVNNKGIITYDHYCGDEGINPKTEHYTKVHWLISTVVGYWVSNKTPTKHTIGFNPSTIYQALAIACAKPSLFNFNTNVPSPSDIIVIVCAKDCKTFTQPFIARWKDTYAEPLMKGVGEDLTIHLHLNNLKFYNNRWISFDDHGH